MGVLTTVAGALPKLWAAVTDQFQSYFSTSRLPRQFLFPALAFLLGCLALAMSIVRPDLIGAWWESLPGDVKALAVGLGLLFYALLVETSRQLTTTVRRLYSGELPAWPPLQRMLRLPYLRERRELDAEQYTLALAQTHLTSAKLILENLDRQQKEAETKTGYYPVPRVDINAYHLIGGQDWDWAELPEETGANGVASPGDLVGRYALAPLAAGEPVPASSLERLPEQRYLDPKERRVLSLQVDPGETGPYLEAGNAVTLHLMPRPVKTLFGSTQPPAPNPFEDLLVLHRPAPEQMVLSVPRDRVADLAKHLPQCEKRFDRKLIDPTQQPKVVVAKPVARQVLPPGHLIRRRDDISWVVADGPLDGTVASQESDLVHPVHGYYYWNTADLQKGSDFQKQHLRKVQDRGWLTFLDSDQKLQSRVAYKLVKQKHRIEVDRRFQVGTPHEIVAKDRLTVALIMKDASKKEYKGCYLYEKTTQAYHIAMKDRDAFEADLTKARTVHLSPMVQVPVLRRGRARQPGQLIASGDLELDEYRANSDALVGMCLEDKQVIDHYVPLAYGWPVPEQKPIPTTAVAPAILSGQVRTTFDRADELARMVAGGEEAQTGEWVTLTLAGEAPEPAFIEEKEEAEGKLKKLVLAVPRSAERVKVLQELWDGGAPAELRAARILDAEDNAEQPGFLPVGILDRSSVVTAPEVGEVPPTEPAPSGTGWKKCFLPEQILGRDVSAWQHLSAGQRISLRFNVRPRDRLLKRNEPVLRGELLFPALYCEPVIHSDEDRLVGINVAVDLRELERVQSLCGLGIPVELLSQDKAWGLLTLEEISPLRRIVGPADLERGVRASFVLKLPGTPEKVVPWAQSFVVDFKPSGSGTEKRMLEVTIPKGDAALAQDLWNKGAMLEATVTHADSGVHERLDTLDGDIPSGERDLKELNRTISERNPDEKRFLEETAAQERSARGLATLRNLMNERPWQGDSPPRGYAHLGAKGEYLLESTNEKYLDLNERLYSTVRNWLAAVSTLKVNRARGAELALPESMADTRPSELANVLAAAAEYPLSAYAIDTASTLPRLTDVLTKDDNLVKNLENREAAMTMSLMFSFWAAVWTVLGLVLLYAFKGTYWMFPVVGVLGTLIFLLTKEAATAQAYAYGEALKTLFDMRRRGLLKALGVDCPKAMTPQEEAVYWRHLTWLFAHGDTGDPNFPKLEPPLGEKEGS